MARHNQVILGRRNTKKIIYLACEGGTSGTEGTYADAVIQAKAWEISLMGAPEYSASSFAGIYKLTESITK